MRANTIQRRLHYPYIVELQLDIRDTSGWNNDLTEMEEIKNLLWRYFPHIKKLMPYFRGNYTEYSLRRGIR